MNKKIYISPSNQESNIYKYGNTNEQKECYQIAVYCQRILKDYGFTVTLPHINLTIKNRVAESNGNNDDIYLCIHTNAYNGKVTGGTQILLYKNSGVNKDIAECIFKKLSPITIGKTSEKIYAEPNFYEIKNTKAICIYVECEFHDTRDGAKFIIENKEKIANAIALGILDFYGIEYEVKKSTLYRVQVGSFKNIENAKALQSRLKSLGFTDSFIL